MKIAIVGYGIEGKASYDYWSEGNELTIVDEREAVDGLPDGVPVILGAEAFTKLADFDLIIRSPGINPHKLPYETKVWSATNEFFEKCPAPIIGVTGTKGKGTTCSLIASILRAAGKSVHLVGNIGAPALAELARIKADDIVVYELSSFQLWDVTASPHVAVVLMIEPDHLDVHESMDDYIAAKANIGRFQQASDLMVFNAQNELSRSIATLSAARKFEYPQPIEHLLSSFKLPGRHNIDNASAAVAATQQYVQNPDVIARGLGAFTGLPHRLKFVAEKAGVKYYDDSIATTPGSAIAALSSFDEPKLIILGGHDKGADYTELVESCARTVSTVLAIGSNGPRIARMCREAGVSVTETDGGMRDIVRESAAIAQSGSVVVLSPAAASFDMFSGYADRGDQFVAAVEQI